MGETGFLEKRLAEAQISALEYLCLKAQEEYDLSVARNDSFAPCYKTEVSRWQKIKTAAQQGRKIVLYAGRIPAEVLWASGCVPVNLDYMQIRLAGAVSFTKKMVVEAEKILPDCFCSLDKTALGTVGTSRLGFEPAAFVSASVPCGASNLGYAFISRQLALPKFDFDVADFRGQTALDYIVEQIAALGGFLEGISGVKQNDAELHALIKRTNRCYELLEECAILRKAKPCPLPGRMLIRNGWANAFSCTEESIVFLEQELAVSNANKAAGRGFCPEGEKHRAAFIQNMTWSAEFATDYLEKQYGCACVTNGISEQGSIPFEDTENLAACYLTMAEKMRDRMGLHGVSWSNAELLELIERTIEDYDTDVVIFAGHVGCRHTWAAVSMISDAVQTRFGTAPLCLQADGLDRGYKSEKDILRELTDYMETVVGG
ncbi:MAG: 2-hydroxyacyl-CoA dehydratase [Clostridia bacterium]|nr:2-hydroxyacyl-CoA dehydratase [Clostridia bacterium]